MASTQSAQILLVTRRDPQDPVRRTLKTAGYGVVTAESPSSALRMAERTRPAVIVVDPRGLPTSVVDGLTSFGEANHIPVVREWSSGEALVAEVERVLPRGDPAPQEAQQLSAGPLFVDFAGHLARIDGSPLELTSREFDLLCHLARHPGWVYSRQELLEQVWGYEFGDPRVVTVHMANLRKKLDAAAPGSELIQTVRNVGYKLVLPAPQPDAATAGAAALTVAGATTAPAGPTGGVAAATAPASAPPPGPPAVAPKGPAADPGRAAEERRLVTVLFAHLGGLTALAERFDFQTLGELLEALLEDVAPCVERYGGHIESLSADTFMATFGAPVGHDNDGEMAIRAAVDIREATAKLTAERRIDGLSVHIGINTGMAITGHLGTSDSRYSVMGEPVDGAACLADIAAPGEILTGLETIRVTAGILESEPGGTAKIRGRSSELAYERVTAIRPGAGLTPVKHGIESVMVGRDEQMALLRAALDRLDEGTGTVIFITGEAGIGKSRLKTEIRYEAGLRGLKWLEGKTLSYGQNISYLPLKEMLQEDCGVDLEDPAGVREQKLRARLDRLFADKSGDLLPALGGLLGLDPSQLGGYQPLGPEEETARKALLDSLSRYLSRLSTEQPVVLALEDVHWLDRSSAALIEGLFTLVAQAPIVISLMGRTNAGYLTEELLAAARRHEETHTVAIELTPLTGRQTQQLVRNLLAGSGMDSSVMRTIEKRSEGNPFFVEEIVRHLIESDSLRLDERGSWQLVQSVTPISIPTTIHGVITARIDGLPEDCRQALVRAAVIGRSFYRSLLGLMFEDGDRGLDESLHQLRERQLIFVKRLEPELEYSFKHALVQEAAYATLLLKQRKDLHRRVAQAIEREFSAQIKDLFGILAYHYAKAEDWDNARTFLVKAGDQSVSMAADTEAVSQYQDAMSALLRAFEASADCPADADEVNWFLAATEPFWLAHRMGDLLDSAQVFYDKVKTACGPADPRTIAATAILAGCHREQGSFALCSSIVEEALTILEEAGRQDDPSLTRLLLLLGLSRLNTDRFAEAEAIFERAVALEEGKDRPALGVLQDLYIFLSTTYYYTGRHDDMRRVIEEVRHRFDLTGTQRGWMLLVNLCSVNFVDGRWDEAAEQAEECMKGIVNPYLRAAAARHLGEVRLAQGAFLEAEEHFTYTVSVYDEVGHASEQFEALTDLAEAQLQAGKLEKAEQAARRVLTLMEATSADICEANALWTLAGIEMARGNVHEADVLLARATDIACAKYSSRHPFCAEVAFRRAELRWQQGRPVEAAEDLQTGVSLLAVLGGPDHPRIRQIHALWAPRACAPGPQALGAGRR